MHVSRPSLMCYEFHPWSMYIHILIKTQHPTNLIISCIVCLWGKREKSFIHIFLAFSQEIWTKENKIINKLCGGVQMECICRYTPKWWPILKGQALCLRSWWWKLKLVHLSGIMSIEVLGSVPKFLISIDSCFFCTEYYIEYF